VEKLIILYHERGEKTMSKECGNYYKTCRNNAGLTQEQAVEKISEIIGKDKDLAVRTLSDYENGGKVPDYVVAAMADVYECPKLGYWHLRNHNPLGKFLPEVTMPQTQGDMAFNLILAQDEIAPNAAAIKQIVASKRICDETGEMCEETEQVLDRAIEGLMQAKALVTSVIFFAKKLKQRKKTVPILRVSETVAKENLRKLS
jgi:transcriptional regulator with XRE-family HTH domain